jgi:hypothetical protein
MYYFIFKGTCGVSQGKFGRETEGGTHRPYEAKPGAAVAASWCLSRPCGDVSNWERGSVVLFVEQLLLMHAYPLIAERTTAQRVVRPLLPIN